MHSIILMYSIKRELFRLQFDFINSLRVCHRIKIDHQFFSFNDCHFVQHWEPLIIISVTSDRNVIFTITTSVCFFFPFSFLYDERLKYTVIFSTLMHFVLLEFGSMLYNDVIAPIFAIWKYVNFNKITDLFRSRWIKINIAFFCESVCVFVNESWWRLHYCQ